MKLILQPFDNSNFKTFIKMVALPVNNTVAASTPKAYERTIEENILSSLDKEIKDILYDEYMDDEQKVALYLYTLKRFLTFKDKVEPSNVELAAAITTDIDEIEKDIIANAKDDVLQTKDEPLQTSTMKYKPMTDVVILSRVHHALKSKVKLLLRRIKQMIPKTQLNWDYSGHIILNGRLISSSNIAATLQNIVKRRPDKTQKLYTAIRLMLIRYKVIDATTPESSSKNKTAIKEPAARQLFEPADDTNDLDDTLGVNELFEDAVADNGVNVGGGFQTSVRNNVFGFRNTVTLPRWSTYK